MIDAYLGLKQSDDLEEHTHDHRHPLQRPQN